MDPSTIIGILEPVALAAASIAMPAVPVILFRAIGVAVTAQQSAAFNTAVSDAARGIYTYLVTNKVPVTDQDAMSAAVTEAVNHVNAVAPPATTRDLPTEHLQSIITRRFGEVLAADPNISVRPNSNVTSLGVTRAVPRQ